MSGASSLQHRSALQRLLGDELVPPVAGGQASRSDVVQRLGAWLNVADAITLRTGLAQVAKAKQTPVQREHSVSLEEELTRTRNSLAQDIAVIAAEPAPKRGRTAGRVPIQTLGQTHIQPLDPSTEFTLLHQRYNELQRRIDMRVVALRAHARDVLSSASPELAKLAALDALMESVLSAREQNLLSTLPAFLKQRFEPGKIAPSPEQADGDAASGASAANADWLPQLRAEFQQALRAELDLRLQPVVGMAQALQQTQRLDSHGRSDPQQRG